MAFLEISHLQKFYGPTHVVQDFNLDVEKGEFVSFLGPSGCGKTTTLRMVAGFETPTSGSIRIAGKDVVNLRPNQRNIGMVFQAYALTGSSLSIVPILLFAQIRGDVLGDPHLGYALAFGMIVVTGIGNALYIWLRTRAERWIK